MQTKLTRPKMAEPVTRILLMEMKSMEVIKECSSSVLELEQW